MRLPTENETSMPEHTSGLTSGWSYYLGASYRKLFAWVDCHKHLELLSNPKISECYQLQVLIKTSSCPLDTWALSPGACENVMFNGRAGFMTC